MTSGEGELPTAKRRWKSWFPTQTSWISLWRVGWWKVEVYLVFVSAFANWVGLQFVFCGLAVIVKKFSMLLSSPFPVLWPERTYLSWDFFFFLTVCNQCFYTHDFSSIQSGICEDKKKTQRTCHCVLPHIPRSLAGLPSLHISESSYILDTISRVFCYTLQEE